MIQNRCLPSKTNKYKLYKVIGVIKIVYNNDGHTIGSIYIETEYKTLMDKVKGELYITIYYTHAYDYVPEPE